MSLMWPRDLISETRKKKYMIFNDLLLYPHSHKNITQKYVVLLTMQHTIHILMLFIPLWTLYMYDNNASQA
jgi:hypothetical protein